jgi:hypothetical protein
LLVRAFDPSIARVEAVVHPSRPAEVFVVVVGASDDVHSGGAASRVSPRRLARLGNYLAERVSLGTTVHVIEPRHVPLRIRVAVPEADVRGERLCDERARDLGRFESELRTFLHPLTGGARGDGAPFGVGTVPPQLVAIVREFRWAGAAGEQVRVEIDSALADGDTLETPLGLPVLEAVEAVLPKPEVGESGGKESARVAGDGSEPEEEKP